MNSLLKIRELLEEKGLKLNDLAKGLDMHRVTLSKQLNNDPPLSLLARIARFLNVKVDELFYHIVADNYVVTKNNINSTIFFKDENLSLMGNLPHFISNDFGSFSLEFEKYNFTILPNVDETYKFVFSDRTIDEQIYVGEHKNLKIIRLFSMATYLTSEEYTSLEIALKLYKKNYKKCFSEVVSKLEVSDFERIEKTDWFRLGKIDRKDWNCLMNLSKMFDLDEKRTDFEVFNATGNSLTIYNDAQQGYNLKLNVYPLQEESSADMVMLAWVAPSSFDRQGITSNEILTAKEAYIFIHEELIPKARRLFS